MRVAVTIVGGSVVAMTTSLITGGAGFIGSHLTEALLARGHRVIVLDDLSTGRLDNLDAVRCHPHLQVVLDNVAHEAMLTGLIDQADAIYHLAAVVGVRLVMEEPARTVSTNLGPTELILRHLAHPSQTPIFGQYERGLRQESEDATP